MNHTLPLAVLAGLGIPASLPGQKPSMEWPSWRGPNQDGCVAAPGQFTRSEDASERSKPGRFGLKTVWRGNLHQGYSSISVAAGKVLTMCSDKVDDLLVAYDAETGERIWRYRLGPMYRGHDGGHDGPPSTPVAHGGTVFALGPRGKLAAVALQDGCERWTVSLRERLGSRKPFWGFCTTPLVVARSHDRKGSPFVVVQAGGSNGRSLAAFSARDGALLWTSGHGNVEYRSPILATLHGREQIVAATSGQTRGVDPSNGKTIWSVAFATNDYTTPVPIGPDCILLEGRAATALYRIPPNGQPRRLWRSDEFGRSNYGVPVAYRGHVYGFTGRFLTCVDLRSGKRRWRSRPPGGKGLIIVDGHLVILGSKGDVVVAAASPSGYREIARTRVSDADGYGWPAFAGGTIFVRNLRHIAAIRTIPAPRSDTPTSSARTAGPPSRFRRFLSHLATASDKRPLIDAFMKSQRSFPIVEDDRLVHFVYRGHAANVGLQGNMLAHNEEDALTRVPGTDFFHGTYPIESGARWEYRLNVDFDRLQRDPRNRRRAGAMSEVLTSGWRSPDFLKRYAGNAPGRMESTRAGGRRVRVYLPNEYDETDQIYPLLVVTEGREWSSTGALPNTLDQLIGNRVAPVVVAFVDVSSYRALGGAGTRSFVRSLATDVVPALLRRYRIRKDAAGHIVLGKRGAAVAAACAALTYPKVFGHCIAISYGRADTVRGQWVAEQTARGNKAVRPRFFVDWNRYDVWRPQSFDVRDQCRALVADLRKHGHEVLGGERVDGAGWKSWRIASGLALQALLPSK